MTEEIKEKEFKGRIGTIDPATRIINMKDSEDVTHPFKWTEPYDVVMHKWKAGYYLTVKYDDETRIIKNTSYWQEGKDVMPKKMGGSGGRPYVPRNDKAIIYQCAYKEACETMRHNMNLSYRYSPDDLDALMDWVIDRAKKDGKALCDAAGVT